MDDAKSQASGNLLGFAKPALQVAGCLVVLLLFRSCSVGVSNWMSKPNETRQQQVTNSEPERVQPRVQPEVPPVVEVNSKLEPEKPSRPQTMDKVLTATPNKWGDPFFVPPGWRFNLGTPDAPLKVRVNGGDPLSGMEGYFNGYRWEGRDSEERPMAFDWPRSVESLEFESSDSAQRVRLSLDAYSISLSIVSELV